LKDTLELLSPILGKFKSEMDNKNKKKKNKKVSSFLEIEKTLD
jgi:hypothetical protein